ncbi:MAG: Fic family protein [Candidatus Methylumidiphilus alinenensis]|uniref:Fic family protein n=1 Tax=Candidatus Methylumidiphilus alinenensis TaxID=2202197 RepID=A0A2W4SMS0_9GAMM|nr:MAG: Fic family protein [Candidatus Methylumidiphilus alinenensis]
MTTLFDGLDADLRLALASQLRDLWTHTSTALEGNTLTLGETAFVLREGLTVSGKPLKDHNEVMGHAKAIGLLYELLDSRRTVNEADLFDLHRVVQTNMTVDIYSPVGAWKREPNGTHATVDDRQVFIEFASPSDVPELMAAWLVLLNGYLLQTLNEEEALSAYAVLHLAFVRIHPFFDGNGRMARLLANLPALNAGLPPILIDRTRRQDYLTCLASYDLQAGPQRADRPLPVTDTKLERFLEFSRECWQPSKDLVAEIRRVQEGRYIG